VHVRILALGIGLCSESPAHLIGPTYRDRSAGTKQEQSTWPVLVIFKKIRHLADFQSDFFRKNCIFNADDNLATMILTECQKTPSKSWWEPIASIQNCISVKWAFICFTVAIGHTSIQAQSLSEVVHQALQNYPSILSANARTEASKTEIDRVRSAHFPQVGLSASTNVFASGVTPEGVTQSLISPSLRLNLWSGGRIEAEAKRAEALSSASEYLQANTLQDVALIAAEAYINWVKTAELHKLAVRNVNAHKDTLSDILKIYRSDRGRRVDYEQALVRMENATLLLQQRESDFLQSAQRLKRFWSGQLSDTPKDLRSDAQENGPLGSLPASVSQVFDTISDNLPSIAQARAQVAAAEEGVRLAKGNYWPTIDLSISRQFNASTRNNELLTQIQMTAPIYTGGNTSAQVQGALLQVRAAQFELDEARLLARENAAIAWQEWASATARSATGSKQAVIGEELILSYRQQFRVARRSLLDLLNIQADAFNYSSSAKAAQYDELLARARLLAATGNLVDRFSFQPNANIPTAQ
jgi:outer membrane protein, adhesin transport system